MLRTMMAGFVVAALWAAAPGQAQDFGSPTRVPSPPQKEGIPLIASCTSISTEIWESRGAGDVAVRNITCPTLTAYLPKKGAGNGTAMIVAPGGAFHILAMKHEGQQVARWLADHGIAAFVLKYRTFPTPADQAGFQKTIGAYMREGLNTNKFETPADALSDAQAAVRMVRARSAEWKIDPKRVGFVGFSAGAMTTLSVGTSSDKGARPDFIAPIYPPMVAFDVPADAPPMFLAIALDDGLFAKGKPLALMESWRAAKRPLEAHFYEKGDHGFGMANRSAASAMWIEELHAWMKDRGLLKAAS